MIPLINLFDNTKTHTNIDTFEIFIPDNFKNIIK